MKFDSIIGGCVGEKENDSTCSDGTLLRDTGLYGSQSSCLPCEAEQDSTYLNKESNNDVKHTSKQDPTAIAKENHNEQPDSQVESQN